MVSKEAIPLSIPLSAHPSILPPTHLSIYLFNRLEYLLSIKLWGWKSGLKTVFTLHSHKEQSREEKEMRTIDVGKKVGADW